MDRAFPRTAFVGGSEVGRVFVGGQEAEFVFGMGTQIMPNLGAEIYGRTEARTVLDDVGEWFEFGFRIDHLLSGNAAAGFVDQGNYFRLEAQQSFDLVNWSMGQFAPAPVPVVDNGDGTWTYWSRAAVPLVWRHVMIDETVASDRYGKSITAVLLFDALMPLGGYPYAMPADAARLQADLRSAGYAGATVTTSPAALRAEVRTHQWASQSYIVSDLPVTMSGPDVTAVRTSTGTLIPLSYPYAMPAQQSALQADLVAAGQSGAVVRLFGDSWSIFIPNRVTTLRKREFAVQFTPGDPYPLWDFFGTYEGLQPDDTAFGTFSNVRPSAGGGVIPEAQKQFARLKITPGTRYDPYQ